MSVSMIKLNWIISISTFLQGLILQYLHKAIINIGCLQPSLPVSLYENILCHLYKGISTVMCLLSPLLTSLRGESLRSSLLISLMSVNLQSSLLTSLRSKFLQSSLLASLWNIFLRCLYKDIPTVTPIPSKPEIFVQSIHPKPEILLQNIHKFMVFSKQVKLEASKSWLPSHVSLQSRAKLFYKYIGYYVIDQNTNNNTWNIKKQAVGYIMFLKRKRRAKVKAKGCAEGHYHQRFNHEVESSSHIVT